MSGKELYVGFLIEILMIFYFGGKCIINYSKYMGN